MRTSGIQIGLRDGAPRSRCSSRQAKLLIWVQTALQGMRRPRQWALEAPASRQASTSTPSAPQFPILSRQVNGRPLVYLGLSGLGPEAARGDRRHGRRHGGQPYANVHRGLHTLANETTDAYEAARERRALHQRRLSTDEIVFTKGATEAINLVAASLGLLVRGGRRDRGVGA